VYKEGRWLTSSTRTKQAQANLLAVPPSRTQKVLIDPEACIEFKSHKCKKTCVEACGERKAIDFKQEARPKRSTSAASSSVRDTPVRSSVAVRSKRLDPLLTMMLPTSISSVDASCLKSMALRSPQASHRFFLHLCDLNSMHASGSIRTFWGTAWGTASKLACACLVELNSSAHRPLCTHKLHAFLAADAEVFDDVAWLMPDFTL